MSAWRAMAGYPSQNGVALPLFPKGAALAITAIVPVKGDCCPMEEGNFVRQTHAGPLVLEPQFQDAPERLPDNMQVQL